ncbi:MAG: Phytochrome-like protein cph1 [Planctomycetes bacterium ADurb.Bin401]|nr:MAG: Phytochrome-like protein cph1 [Planctomycetes bacterium ADurb.Bin401]
MNLLRNMTIKYKLLSIVMLACLSGLLLAGSAFIGWNQNMLRNRMIKNLSTRAQMVAESCKASLAFQDNKDAAKILEALHVDNSIVFGGIYDDNDELFAAYYRNDNIVKKLPANFKHAFDFSGGLLSVSCAVVLDNQRIGTICLQSDLSSIKKSLQHSVRTITLVIILSLMAVFLLSTRLQSIISAPLLSLAKLAKVVSEKKDYSARAVKQSNDEVGSLIDAFNEMLRQIQQRDSELIEAKAGLEIKVQERTAEISRTNEKLKNEIAERQKAEEDMKRLNCELENSMSKLEEANQEMKNFVYIASHDLREPLRKITAFGSILEKSLGDKLNGDDAENLRFMVDGAMRMSKMIEGLLIYSRVSSKTQPPQLVDLNEIVTQLQQLELAVVLQEKQAVIEIPRPLPSVEADPVQIRQLLQNLIANGIKYQPKNRTPKIVITCKPSSDGMIRVEVNDNGIGIKAEYLSSIFVMFKRLHTRTEYEGTGIGLSVCKKIVERHGGKIGVESQPDVGSTFWFTVPEVKNAVAISQQKL